MLRKRKWQNIYCFASWGCRLTPRMMAALAGVIHDRQAAAGHEHNRGESISECSFFATSLWPPGAHRLASYRASNEPTVNARDTRLLRLMWRAISRSPHTAI